MRPDTLVASRRLHDAASIAAALARMADEIVAQPWVGDGLAIIGIQRRGAVLGQRLHQLVQHRLGKPVDWGILDITLYRDDLAHRPVHPVVNRTIIEFDITGRPVILVDDVLYTGRTIRAALDVLADLGRPSRVFLVPLIDRGLREYPIQPDIVGHRVSTTPMERVRVLVQEVDGEEGVDLLTMAERQE